MPRDGGAFTARELFEISFVIQTAVFRFSFLLLSHALSTSRSSLTATRNCSVRWDINTIKLQRHNTGSLLYACSTTGGFHVGGDRRAAVGRAGSGRAKLRAPNRYGVRSVSHGISRVESFRTNV